MENMTDAQKNAALARGWAEELMDQNPDLRDETVSTMKEVLLAEILEIYTPHDLPQFDLAITAVARRMATLALASTCAGYLKTH